MSEGSLRTNRRSIAALALGLAAVVTALLAARGPAVAERAAYSWPPHDLPSGAPTTGWYAPLLLAQQHAERIDARVPCGDLPTVPDAGRDVLLFSTVRNARDRNGLSVTRSSDGRATVRVGERVLAHTDAGDASDCALDVRFDERAWTIRQDGGATMSGTVKGAPAVTGFFSELDLRAQPGLRASITPHVQDTRASTTQSLLRVSTVVLLAAAILVLLPGVVRRRPISGARPRLTPHDGAALTVIGLWWFLAPLHFDDGWVRAREQNYLDSGGFSTYYEYYGANLPLATWFEWLQHFVVAYTSSLALDRLPTVLVLCAMWVVCRSCLVQLLGRRPDRRDAAWWAGTAAFCLGVVAFGMTLRADPVVALLVVGVLACCVRYATRPSLGPLVVAVTLASLAVTVHPAGIVSTAPLALCVPRMWRDARRRNGLSLVGLVAVLSIGLAWTALLTYLDSDISRRGDDIALIRSGGWHAMGLLDETRRYENLGGSGASVVRREFVALLLLVVLAGTVGRFLGRRTLVERLPSTTVALGLVLLAFTPSKWIWHFGGFIGIAAVAFGVETEHLRRLEASGKRVVAIAVAIAAISIWAALDPNEWGPLDVGKAVLYDKTAPYVAATLLAVTGLLVMSATKRVRADLALVPAVAAGLVGVTVVATAGDAFVTDGWTAPQQALFSLVGADGCGLADELGAPEPTSTAQPLADHLRRSDAVLVGPFLFEAMPCAGLPTLSHGLVAAPRLLVDWAPFTPLAGATSPFRGVVDVYVTRDVPVKQVGKGEETVVVRWTVPIPGETLAEPERRTWLE